MSYDPCGTRRLDGDDILKRLAEHLKVEVVDLEVALKNACDFNKSFRAPTTEVKK